MTAMKTCTACEQSKPLDQFNKDAKRADGLDHRCRECNRKRQKAYREDPSRKDRLREEARLKAEARRKTDGYKQWLEQSRELRRSYKEKYRRLAGALSLGQLQVQRDAVRAERDVQRQAAVAAALHDAHVREFKSDKARYLRWKYLNDPTFNVYHRLKRWMHKHLADQLPSRKWTQHLGYTPAELRCHIERQFEPGMSWENKGQWHIDHIVPVSAFRIESIDSPEFRACFGLANLRPVWARVNLSKGSKRTHLL